MRIVAIADTHSQHDDIVIPDGDVLVHAGDSTYQGTINEIASFNTWLGKLPHKHKVVIAGNHDWLFERNPTLAKEMMFNCTYLKDSGTVINGIKFWGSPYSPRFFDWAFNQDRGPDIKRFWDLIPNNTDVLVTHGPPEGFGDIVQARDTKASLIHVGCYDLLQAIERVKPKLHIFGHIHECKGEYEYGTTKLFNVSICDGKYKPINTPTIIDL